MNIKEGYGAKLMKFVKAVKGFDWGDMGRTAVGFGVVAVGSGIGAEIGSLIGGFLASNYISKSDFSKKFVMGVALLNTIDLLFERFSGGRGVVG